MPIISTIGRKTARGRAVSLFIYAVLLLGSVTMVYPFLLMLGGAMSNAYDADEFAVVPGYLTHDDAMAKKFLYAKYGLSHLDDLAGVYDADDRWMSWEDLRREPSPLVKTDVAGSEGDRRRVEDWYAFKKSLDPASVSVYFAPDSGVEYPVYTKFLREKYTTMVKDDDRDRVGAALAMLNLRHGRSYHTFEEVLPPADFFEQQKWFPPSDRADAADWAAFKAQLQPALIAVPSQHRLWKRYLQKRFISVKDLNLATGLNVRSVTEVPFPVTTLQKDTPLEKVWIDFLHTNYPLRLVTLKPETTPLWKPFLENRFGSIEEYNRLMNAHEASFDTVRLSARAAEQAGPARLLWIEFVLQAVPMDLWNLNLPAEQFRQFLQSRYGDIGKLNAAYGSERPSFDNVDIPERLSDAVEFRANKTSLRWNFATVNYRRVLDYLLRQDRALYNTIVLVLLAVASALTVNPLAAYVLSRGNQKVSHKVLIFFLATMAFPAEVAMIPGFLLLRDLGMLNTFAALVIPGMANGYSIFLLKGFFDSIPAELYEAATIDGARERQMFLYVTYPMCKPILAVIALGAFTAAYGGFMWAFLVCQDSSMWTLMVWLYVFQSDGNADPGMVMASLALASIPTLLVFLFCQKLIMRGIIIPTMK